MNKNNKCNCPLCGNREITTFFYKKLWDLNYFKCQNCSFIFMDPKKRLSISKEKEVYNLHQNNPGDEGYKEFLSKLTEKLPPFLIPKNEFKLGLDFGCGPGPTLTILLKELGIYVNSYDPIFFNSKEFLNTTYDIITCTEVIEHFFNPTDEFTNILKMLRPKGIFGVMTWLYDNNIDFENWHYIRDHTHVSLYSIDSINWIAKNYNLKILDKSSRVIIFQKN